MLTEEPSAVPVIEALAALICHDTPLRVIPHEGISDLRKSLPRKLRAWRNPEARFIVLCDQDNADCVQRKAEFAALVRDTGRAEQTRIRIVCSELESWFLGDAEAIERAELGSAVRIAREVGARNVDEIKHPVELLKKHCPGYSKIINAQRIAPYLEPARNGSESFRQFVAALEIVTA